MGKSIPRRTPTELLYVLKALQCTRLVIVEGYSDRAFYRWLLDWRMDSRFAVHAIDEIDVPVEWLSAQSEYASNRKLVAASALRLSEDRGAVRALGVVDSDCGVPAEWTGHDCIVATDFPSIESFCFTPETLQKWVLLTLDLGDKIDGVGLRDELAPILAGLYAVRSETGSLGGSVDQVVAFDSDTWTAHFRADPARAQARVRIYNDARVGLDPRETCYGHDLAAVLMIRFIARIKNRVGLRSVDSLERSLVAHLEQPGLAESNLGQTLIRWIAEDAA